MKRLLVVLAIILFAVLPRPVSAGNSIDIQVFVSPDVAGLISNFTATYISDTQVDLSWVKGEGVSNVIIRAKYGSAPVDETDGYLVYDGVGNAATDTSMNFDETTGVLYYVAFGETAPGVYGFSTNDSVEGVAMYFIGFILLALGFTIASYALRKSVLGIMAGGVWALVSFFALTLSSSSSPTNITDVYMGLFWLGIIFVIVCIFEAVYMNGKKNEEHEDTALVLTDAERMENEMEDMRRETMIPNFGRRTRKSKMRRALGRI